MLESDHVVGRLPTCKLRFDDRYSYISAQHARIHWTGEQWEIRDLASKNGTFVDGRRLSAGEDCALRAGQVIALGHPEQAWRLEDASAPRFMVLGDGNRAIVAEDDLVVLPSPEAPLATLYKTSDGVWVLERANDALLPLQDQQVFELVGESWRVCCPDIVGPTANPPPAHEVKQITLHFGVSRDEEHVEIHVGVDGADADLGSRAHNYILLTLARRRLADAEAGIPETSCGWVYQDELVTELGTTGPQLNVDIFRIRRQFAALPLVDAAHIIERRPRTGQLRIGVPRSRVDRL